MHLWHIYAFIILSRLSVDLDNDVAFFNLFYRTPVAVGQK
jgi:hypothetical protein